MTMEKFEALQIVLDLARQNVISEFDMPEEHARQVEAIEIIERLADSMA